MTNKLLQGVFFAVSVILAGCDGTSVGGNSSAKPLLPERDADNRPNIIVILTDDQGYADVGAHGIASDIQTPNIDQLAKDGVMMSAGYATAPQCAPSRAALMTGKYQQQFGLDDNNLTPLPLEESTLANYLQDAGYRTGMIGKWHLEIFRNSAGFDRDNLSLEQQTPYFPDARGFEDVHFGYANNWWTNFDLNGSTQKTAFRKNTDFRVDIANDAAQAFIERHQSEPFFLFLSHYAPHIPLEATTQYLSRFDHIAQERRKYGLAMMSAIDDGVGQIRAQLESLDLEDNTLIFFISDNGAPLGQPNMDVPVSDTAGVWDGSLNDPWIGEKGMLSEGGIRVPYIVTWPGRLPAGTQYHNPVSTLDVLPTSLVAAGAEVPAGASGQNLLPYLSDNADTTIEQSAEERALYWRFWSQSAVRQGDWKYLSIGDSQEYLFNLSQGNGESENLLEQHPDVARTMRTQLINWTDTLKTPGLVTQETNRQEDLWFELYFPSL